MALLDGNASIFQYTDERLADARVRSLMARISVETDTALDGGYPHRRGARIELELSDGRIVRHALDNARGEPEQPLSTSEIDAKFLALATPRLGEGAERLREAVMSLETFADVAAIAPRLQPEANP